MHVVKVYPILRYINQLYYQNSNSWLASKALNPYSRTNSVSRYINQLYYQNSDSWLASKALNPYSRTNSVSRYTDQLHYQNSDSWLSSKARNPYSRTNSVSRYINKLYYQNCDSWLLILAIKTRTTYSRTKSESQSVHLSHAGLWIRIDFLMRIRIRFFSQLLIRIRLFSQLLIRIRIQDRIRIWIQIQFRIKGFDDQKLEKILNKNCNLLILRPLRRSSYRRSLQPSKENILHFEAWKFFTFLWVIYALLDPATPINADPCGPDPDPQTWSHA